MTGAVRASIFYIYLIGVLVLPLGLNSNRVEQLQMVIRDWVEIYKSPPQLDGKTFEWMPASG